MTPRLVNDRDTLHSAPQQRAEQREEERKEERLAATAPISHRRTEHKRSQTRQYRRESLHTRSTAALTLLAAALPLHRATEPSGCRTNLPSDPPRAHPAVPQPPPATPQEAVSVVQATRTCTRPWQPRTAPATTTSIRDGHTQKCGQPRQPRGSAKAHHDQQHPRTRTSRAQDLCPPPHRSTHPTSTLAA